jgi:glutamate synthase (NADPH) small chain
MHVSVIYHLRHRAFFHTLVELQPVMGACAGVGMLSFVHQKQRYPDVSPADTRKTNFHEIYQRFALERAQEQASRCSQCGIPFCQVHCPLQNNIPDWLKLTAEGRLREAYELSSATNTFPEICGRICPQDRLCEGNCVINKDFGAVTIGAVENFLTENAWEQGYVQPIVPEKELEQSVGIIGSGPAGLAAAEMLRRLGWQVTIYDRHHKAGGLLMYGIPSFKLEKWVVERRTAWLAEGGVKFKQGIAIGVDMSMSELRQRHDAVLIATGVYQPRPLTLNENLDAQMIPALDYLIASQHEKQVRTQMSAAGKQVVVIGGGDTAMDCVRTAIRQGATSVNCVYRRDRDNMPGSAREVKNAEEEGVNFTWLTAPTGLRADKSGKIDALEVVKMRTSAKDAFGRAGVEVVAGSNAWMPAQMVILALGFEPELLPALFDEPALEVRRNGCVVTQGLGFQTSLDGVYAAGDIVRGASLVVWAIKDGRDAAAEIHQRYVMEK